jgi:hypothetical protein
MTQLFKNHATLIAAAAGLVLLAVTITWLWSNHRIARLESEVSETKAAANEKDRLASQRETEAAQYKQKIDYLEQQLADIQHTARKQDEHLTKLNTITNNARRDVDRARRTKSVAVTNAELCQKLAELEHPCE